MTEVRRARKRKPSMEKGREISRQREKEKKRGRERERENGWARLANKSKIEQGHYVIRQSLDDATPATPPQNRNNVNWGWG